MMGLVPLEEKKDTNKFIHRTETDSDFETTYDCQRGQVGGWEGEMGVWDWHMHTEVYGMTG